MFRAKRGRVAGIVICGLAAAGAAASVALGRQHVVPTVVTFPDPSAPTGIAIHGIVGPGFNISLTNANEQPVAWLQPGTYTFTIDDLSSIHDFHLYGPGVDVQTTVIDTGTTTWTVKLTPGTYTFVCDPHASTMTGTFGVAGYGTLTSFPAPKAVASAHRRRHKAR